MPSIADEAPLQARCGDSRTKKLLRSFGFFFFGRNDDLEEGLLGSSSSSSSSKRKSESIKHDIIVTLLAVCASLLIRFLWLLLTIVGDIMASDKARFSRGACADDQGSVFLLFITANSVPWVIYAFHVVAEPLPVFITVWTMGRVGDNSARTRR